MILLFGIIMIMDDNRNAISNHIDKKHIAQRWEKYNLLINSVIINECITLHVIYRKQLADYYNNKSPFTLQQIILFFLTGKEIICTVVHRQKAVSAYFTK